MRNTSISAYKEIRSNGLLSARRLEVYEVLFNFGPLTATEIWSNHFSAQGLQMNSVTPRTAELKKLGVITEVGYRICTITGMNVILWDVTSSLPSKPPKRKSKDQTIRILRDTLRLSIGLLKAHSAPEDITETLTEVLDTSS